MKLSEVDSIGTSLAALIPPVGLLGAMEYYRTGQINLKYALVNRGRTVRGRLLWRTHHINAAAI